MNIMGQEYDIYAARGNAKSSRWMHYLLTAFATIGKKKKAFLKYLRALGYKQDILNSYEKYIKENKGKIEYSWTSFQYYIYTNYCSCEGGIEK